MKLTARASLLLEKVFLATMIASGVQSLYAVQPVSDEYLSESASENSLVLNEKLINSKRFIVEQDIANRETPGYQTVDIINVLYPASFERAIGERNDNFTANFGSEFYSQRWTGNYQDLWDLNQYYDVSFNHSTGDYELNNVRGRIWIETEINRSNQ